MIRRMFRADRKTNRAGLVSRLSGVAGGLRQSRRGSFLIMVVGTLALLSVITVIYVSIGRSDRQTSAAAQKFDERKDAPGVVRDYIAGIIADDVFDHYYGGERDFDNQPVFRRESWDYPSAPRYVVLPDGATGETVPTLVTVGEGTDARFHFTPTGNGTGTDPWLASAEPTLLNFDPSAYTYATDGDPASYYLERLDWQNMSNIAPDGAAVNLFNLRRYGIDATPWEMRESLSMFEGPPAGGARGQQTDLGVVAQPSDDEGMVPSEWTSRVRWGAYPTAEPDYRPADEEYLLYQFADADGDGILDSRWVELVEDRSPNDQLSEYLLPPEDGMRYFVATRIVDLSGRVNVNTATDGTLAPLLEDPSGLTPSAINLRRLLTGEDFLTDQRVGFFYDRHIQPDHPQAPNPNDPGNYAEYTDLNGPFSAYSAGQHAYDALRMVIDVGQMPPAGFGGLSQFAFNGSVDREFSLVAGGGMLNAYWDPYWKLPGESVGPSQYYSLYGGFGAAGGSGYQAGGNFDSGFVGRPFGLDSLYELLTFNGVNNDRVRSPLEVALGGRGDPNVVPAALASRFSPLRDNRPTDEVERNRGAWLGPNFTFFDEAKAALYTDMRQRLTTVSFSRPLMPTVLSSVLDPDLNEYVPDPNQLELTTADAKESLDNVFAGGAPTSSLYKIYADALAPYSEIQQSPNHWDGSAPEFDTLYYGYRGPELALRTAAHLAVNMADSYDEGSAPTKRTVLLNGSDQFRRTEINGPGGRNARYPWILLDLDEGYTGPDTRLWRTNSGFPTGMPSAVNVFGIEAQPFLTEVATYIMYTDTPNAYGGDKDDEPAIGGGGFGGGLPKDPPTINGRVPDLAAGDSDNPDFLFEVIAFQIHNPFDETIQLSGNAGAGDVTTARRGLYYIQYGDRYYKLSDVDFETDTEGDLLLGGGDTKTFYVLSQDTEDIAERIHNITGNAAYGGKTLQEEEDRLERWLDRQLGEEAQRLTEFDRTTGQVNLQNDEFAGFIDIQSGNSADRQIVRLWRVEKPFEENGGIDIAGSTEGQNGDPANDPANDAIVDRLRDPEIGNSGSLIVTLDRRGPGGNQNSNNGRIVRGADRGFEPPSTPTGDNRGLTITRYASIRRHDDPNAAPASGRDVPEGGLPAYCIETKSQDPAYANASYDDGGTKTDWEISDFNGKEADDTLDDLLDKQSFPDPNNGGGGGSLTQLIPTVSTEPGKKWSDPKNGVTADPIDNNLANVPFEGGLAGGFYYPPRYVEPNIDNDEFEDDTTGVSRMRVADLLLPLGIGPFQIPDDAIHGGNEDVEWTTLSEALAMALYYEDDALTSQAYAGAFDEPTAGSTGVNNALLDRGHVRFDWFVPFVDLNLDLEYTVGEPRWGLGVPAAAMVLDAFSPLPEQFGSLSAPTQGLLNINTASREALRSLPMLSPPSETNPDGSANWWWTGVEHDWNSDIATTMYAFRDRVSVFTRDPTGAGAAEQLNFRDWFDTPNDPFNSGRSTPLVGFAPGETPADNARWGNTGVPGINEQPGFRSLGEVAFLRAFGFADDSHDIDRHAFDEQNLDDEGLDTIGYDHDGDGVSNDDDEIVDDFGERLAIANSVLTSSSVRSDVFAVWFVLHGYEAADLRGLNQQDPMVPSLARRFVMVVDRSNVVEPGDKPRILLFREVPL